MVALSAPAVTVTAVEPTEIAVTTPSILPTVATAGLADDHSSAAGAAIARSRASRICTVRRSDAPTKSPSADPEMESFAGPAGSTDTVAVALSVPAVAVTVVVPAEIAVTTPSLRPTLATAGFAEDHSSDARRSEEHTSELQSRG